MYSIQYIHVDIFEAKFRRERESERGFGEWVDRRDNIIIIINNNAVSAVDIDRDQI